VPWKIAKIGLVVYMFISLKNTKVASSCGPPRRWPRTTGGPRPQVENC